ncbi:ATP synthase delta-subunit gene [Striga asiatica]|uniref:ATP synthase delta-subunit protein n=1 Tax=Striga asiatica TaxID=4170 RepID=A0A5A7QUW6_STRAF|nr:ATP synthase delta-subunit gene [Striga asiatica]
MDTLLSSTSLSTLSISGLRHHPKAHHLKTHFPRLPISPTANPQKTPNKAAAAIFAPHRNNHPPLTTFNPSPQSANPPPKPQSCRNPATGYAAALLDVAKSHAALESVNRDVTRLSKWLGRPEITSVVSSPNLGKREKGEILREMVTRGNFHKYLVKLVNLLVGKRDFEVGMLGEVLMEFTRIYGELLMGGPSGAADGPVVLASSGVRMGRDQISGVAERIRKISGAVKVITVRQHAGDHRLPAFAV